METGISSRHAHFDEFIRFIILVANSANIDAQYSRIQDIMELDQF
jgi:hypothetical protein